MSSLNLRHLGVLLFLECGSPAAAFTAAAAPRIFRYFVRPQPRSRPVLLCDLCVLCVKIPTQPVRKPLKLHHQISLPHHQQRYLHHLRLFPLQIHPHLPIHKPRQPTLKKLLLPHRLIRRNLHQPPHKPRKILRREQRPIHPRRTTFQRVPRRPRYQLLHIQNHAQLLANPLAIRVTNLGISRFRRHSPRSNSRSILRRLTFETRDSGRTIAFIFSAINPHRLRHPVDIHPQKPFPSHLPFDVNDFQPFRTCYPSGGFPNFLANQAETPRPSPIRHALQPAATKKWACAHSPCDPLQSENRVYSRSTAKARYARPLDRASSPRIAASWPSSEPANRVSLF